MHYLNDDGKFATLSISTTNHLMPSMTKTYRMCSIWIFSHTSCSFITSLLLFSFVRSSAWRWRCIHHIHTQTHCYIYEQAKKERKKIRVPFRCCSRLLIFSLYKTHLLLIELGSCQTFANKRAKHEELTVARTQNSIPIASAHHYWSG